jgi:hypothetical protein
MPFDLSRFKKKIPFDKNKKEDEKKGKKKLTSPSANFMKRFSAAK